MYFYALNFKKPLVTQLLEENRFLKYFYTNVLSLHFNYPIDLKIFFFQNPIGSLIFIFQ